MKTTDQAVSVAMKLFWKYGEAADKSRGDVANAVKKFYDDATIGDMEFKDEDEIVEYIMERADYWPTKSPFSL